MHKFNQHISYSYIHNYITIYAKPSHTLLDVLRCKKWIRRSINNAIFKTKYIKVVNHG